MWSNFALGAPSRKRLREGDVFALHYPQRGYVFGRVIKPKAYPQGERGIMAGSTLIYIYAGVRDSKDVPPDEHLLASNWLIAPMFVDRSLWSLGGGETVGNVALTEGHVLETHCFERAHGSPIYWDGEGNTLTGPVEPVGEMVLHNVRSIDLRVSRALGLPDPPGFEQASPPTTASQNSVVLIESPEHDRISVCLYVEHDAILALGERIHARFVKAYMNGYNWEALVHLYVRSADPELMEQVGLDAEAGLFAATMRHSAENLAKMRRFETHVRDMLADEAKLMAFIEVNQANIDWT